MCENSIKSPHLPAQHPSIPAEQIGVLLINLGTPDATDFWSIRKYLKEFLSDTRVIEVNRILWSLILNVIILNVRPLISAKAYKAIWVAETNESPLRLHTRDQAQALSERVKDSDVGIKVDWAMRYGSPSIAERLDGLLEQGCRKILLFPLYPQYSATTTASALDKAFQALEKIRWQPAIKTVSSYHDHDGYVTALANSVKRHYTNLDWEPDILLTSFHGLPKRYLDAGDPYHCQCAKTSRLIAEKLGWDAGTVKLAFQSRFGREEWLKPYIQELITSLPQQGIRKLAVISPGFVSDCVETLEEVVIGLQESFYEAGGEKFTYIPCLNATLEGIDVLNSIISNELAGWTSI